MTWRYVAARKTHRSLGDLVTGVVWTVREYYDDVADAGPAWTAEPIAPAAETLEDLRQDLWIMLEDTKAGLFLDLDADPPALRPVSEA